MKLLKYSSLKAHYYWIKFLIKYNNIVTLIGNSNYSLVLCNIGRYLEVRQLLMSKLL